MRSQTLPFGLATLLLSLTATYSALAEPPAQIPYVNRSTGECALYITSSEHQARTPLDRSFAELSLPRQPEACKELLHKVLAYRKELRPPYAGQLEEAATQPPCERLASRLPRSVEHTCKALGYRYVGELPVSTHPCYPGLAPFLGAECAPLVWIHLAAVIAVLASLGALVYVIFRRRGRRRRAMAEEEHRIDSRR